jgi:UDP-GlcNAc3NAcA epimerase
LHKDFAVVSFGKLWGEGALIVRSVDEPIKQKQNGAVTWISVVGARPQFVKLAPVCRAIQAHNERSGVPRIEHKIIHTGQHYDPAIADLFFVQMNIPAPDYNLSVGSGSHGVQLARMLERLEPVLMEERPDWVIVYGDTNSTLAGALIAARLHLRLAHVEAGCRSADMRMPEEQTRIVADHLSHLLLAPSQSAVENLQREGIAGADDPRERRATMVGDVMYDALLGNMVLAEEYVENNLKRFDLESGGYYLLTLHRAENTDNPERLRQILDAAQSLELPVLFPVHPRTKNILSRESISLTGNLRPIEPLGYFEMLAAEKHARKILTDSGGVQKEAFYLGVPCITLRDRTEWPETVEVGANILTGTDPDKIREAVRASQMVAADSLPYGDGRASQKIINELLAVGVEQHSFA